MNNELGCIKNNGKDTVKFLIRFIAFISFPRIFTRKRKTAITKPIKNGKPPKKKLKNTNKFRVNIIRVTFTELYFSFLLIILIV
jgi:hypothetical protein